MWQNPERDSMCYKCGKRGHFATAYLSKSVGMLSEDSAERKPIETSYLNAVINITKLQNPKSKLMGKKSHL